MPLIENSKPATPLRSALKSPRLNTLEADDGLIQAYQNLLRLSSAREEQLMTMIQAKDEMINTRHQ
jgi:hypothetical protein